MNDERKRILRMLAEDKISLEECEGLLDALEEKERKPTERPQESNRIPLPPNMQRVLVVFVAVVAVWFVLQSFPPSRLVLLLFWPAFWIWMIVDCGRRDPCEFPFWDKRSWLLLVILVPAIGAVIYKVAVLLDWKRAHGN